MKISSQLENNFDYCSAKDTKKVGAGFKPALFRGLRDLGGESVFRQCYIHDE